MMKQARLSLVILAVAVAAALGACKAGGPESPFQILDSNATSLRERFNTDAGKVRVIMLVAPS
jgi:hypothetical protein